MDFEPGSAGRSLLPRSYYEAPIPVFVAESPDIILATLTRNNEGSLDPEQRDAWLQQIPILTSACRGIDGQILLEFNIPRMGRRIDAVLVLDRILIVLEFKVGQRTFGAADVEQVWDYALDLKNFHKSSHDVPILPILIATNAGTTDESLPVQHEDLVWSPACANTAGLRQIIDLGRFAADGPVIRPQEWSSAPYHPTPTIIEAARSLYATHSVEEIARHDAGARNLAVTSRRLEEVVDDARLRGKKIICFVTGVPGAGKTLVGLNIATRRSGVGEPTHAVFLSGNGPLVAVLREALTRDEYGRRRSKGESVRKGEIGESVKAFIQNVHHFRDEALRDAGAPFDHVVIFDEAQRAWNREQTSKFMKVKKKQADFSSSEPEFLLSYMNRHKGWAAVLCLVGGGQEINTGEAGIAAWLDAMRTDFADWEIYISPELKDSEYASGRAIENLCGRPGVSFDGDLHLAVSMRSFRAENVSAFVKAVLDCEVDTAREAFSLLQEKYPIYLTRDVGMAKRWIHQHARGSERFGLVASSGAQRLKPHAIDVRVEINPVHWFLNGREDTRSSFYLEDAATEFQIQGLELDWVCVTWDGDLRYCGDGWQYREFHGSSWRGVNKPDSRNYLRNAYRVLLTRARQGMVIFVPEGDPEDPTRLPAFYDSTFNYLKEVGIPEICG